ncbi:glycoside hydrolase superfamily [Jimgerdemannia flammicorona]|uniref:alpha-amylase n=1 Tax=Jimgerdemannia flammicorona TaxID=994334 RepID=A0A433Q450_9FUNG|nr:glycoside hydrolase superfamily [Jimgerdemannia flammicorona]
MKFSFARTAFLLVCLLQFLHLAVSALSNLERRADLERRAVPSSAYVQLDYYTYTNGVFSGQIYIKNVAYSKIVTLYYSTSAGVWNVAGNSISASYSAAISGTSYEYWVFSATITSGGISQFYIKYDVSGNSYYDNNSSNNYKVTTTATSTSTTTSTTTATSTPLPWAQRTIYQILTDRFAKSTDSTAGCSDFSNYCGGTYQGIINNLPYISNMGFDAIWISPIPVNSDKGYHGYWATDFYNLNTHFGSAADLKALVAAAHNIGMYVMLDVVANHAGPTSSGYSGYTFASSSFYHPNNCTMSDSNQNSLEQCWIAGSLPDIDTENASNVNILNDIVHTWVTAYGFDGIRIDTFKHIRKDFWPGYLSAAGVFATAEVYSGDSSYVGPYQQYAQSIINYPLYYPLLRGFGAKQTLTQLKTQIAANKAAFTNTALLTNFVNNHDNPRFLNTYNDLSLFKNALTFTLLAEGIPIVYYGDEQAYAGGADPGCREPLWTSGYPTTSEMYLFVQKVITKARKTLATDTYMDLWVNDRIFAFRRGKGLVVLSNYGLGSGTTQTMYLSGQFTEDQPLVDIFTSQTITVSSGYVTVTISNGMPLIFV